MVGLTKVGKISLINSLKRHRACPTSLTPGAIQEVQVESKVKLHDYPGMVLASGNMTDSSVALRNTIKIENQADPTRGHHGQGAAAGLDAAVRRGTVQRMR